MQACYGPAFFVLADWQCFAEKWNGRSGGIRTPGPLVPNQMRYQAALHSDEGTITALINLLKG